MGFTGEEVHTERLNEELSVRSVMNSITVKGKLMRLIEAAARNDGTACEKYSIDIMH